MHQVLLSSLDVTRIKVPAAAAVAGDLAVMMPHLFVFDKPRR